MTVRDLPAIVYLYPERSLLGPLGPRDEEVSMTVCHFSVIPNDGMTNSASPGSALRSSISVFSYPGFPLLLMIVRLSPDFIKPIDRRLPFCQSPFVISFPSFRNHMRSLNPLCLTMTNGE